MEKKLTDEEIVKALEYEKEHLLREEKLTGNAYDTQSVYMRGEGVLAILNLIHRLQAEIERLTEEKWNVQDDLDCYHATNTELQKQVDELKTELEKAYETERANIQAEIADAGTSCHWCKQQAVKDTAKEILQGLLDFANYETFRKGYELVKVKRRIKEIAKEKGVEVE